MFNHFRLFASGAIAVALVSCTLAVAIDFAWPDHGAIRFDAPESWILVGRQAEEIGYVFNVRPKSGAPALLQITLVAKAGMKAVAADDLPSLLERMTQEYVSGSVERKFLPQPLPLAHGVGYYAQFTDASLVGQPLQKDNYKVMRNAVAALDPQALVIITIQFDDPGGPEVADMMAIVRSMRFDRSLKAATTNPASAPSFVFTRPQSKLRVEFPNVKAEMAREGYFLGGIDSLHINVSGWLEPEQRYRGLEKFWAKESRGKIAGTLGREGAWETVAYKIDLTAKDLVQWNLRAELVRDGTWVDLHLSTIGKAGESDMPQRLLNVLREVKVSTK